MSPSRRLVVAVGGIAAVTGCCSLSAHAEAPQGSTSFCLFELPADAGGRRRWINLGIVQYVEAEGQEVRIAYGGGNLGSGHEARIAVSGADAAGALVERMRAAAANCR